MKFIKALSAFVFGIGFGIFLLGGIILVMVSDSWKEDEWPWRLVA